MSAGAIAVIIVIVALVILGIAALSVIRRRRLQKAFGPEYDRVAGEMQSHRKADAELAQRERRVRSLDIHPLDETARVKYAGEWTAIQERFVDQPGEAVAQAGMLVTSVMKDRGYPTEGYEQIVADLSVEHANTLDHYRAAHDVSLRAEAGNASTEDLRRGMLHYRALFADLLGTGPDQARAVGAAGTGTDEAGTDEPGANRTGADRTGAGPGSADAPAAAPRSRPVS